MQLSDQNFNFDFLEVFKSLDLVRFLLHSDNELMLFIIHKLSTFIEERVLKIAAFLLGPVR